MNIDTRKIIAGVLTLVIGLGAAAILSGKQADYSYEEAVSELNALITEIDWRVVPVQRKAKLSLGNKPNLNDTLPAIDQYPFTVNPKISAGDLVVEVFVTTTRSGAGTDGHMVEVARAFNESDQRLSNGRRARIRIRKIASGTGYQYIAARKYLPDAFSPVHHLWMQMLKAHGIPLTPIRESMVVSVGGVVMKDSVAQRLRSSYGQLDVKAVIDDVVQGKMAMGYTNPFASSTGLNFLTTILSTFADGREDAMLSPEVIDTFERFQKGVPFVALTTLHMRDSVRNEGSLDAFIMGHQTFNKTAELQSGYEFIPFGVLHDHPLYATGNVGPEKLEALELLAKFAERPEFRRLAADYGWNQPIATGFTPTVPLPAGDTLIRAQKLWKEKKDAGRPISAVFVSDISGSMDGTRLRGVKKALRSGSRFIAPENAIGLVLFNDTIRIVLPIGTFGLNQRAAFLAAVEDMTAGGSTAMHDGIALALSMLVREREINPEIKPMVFVLTDGDTNEGLKFGAVRAVFRGLKIPIYTIGYEADLAKLRELSSLVEAASLNAQEGNVEYKIGSLLNAQM